MGSLIFNINRFQVENQGGEVISNVAFEGSMLVKVREGAGLTILDAALQCGVSAKKWRKWEEGKSRPNMDELEAICNGLAIHPFFLFSFDTHLQTALPAN